MFALSLFDSHPLILPHNFYRISSSVTHVSNSSPFLHFSSRWSIRTEATLLLLREFSFRLKTSGQHRPGWNFDHFLSRSVFLLILLNRCQTRAAKTLEKITRDDDWQRVTNLHKKWWKGSNGSQNLKDNAFSLFIMRLIVKPWDKKKEVNPGLQTFPSLIPRDWQGEGTKRIERNPKRQVQQQENQ